MSKDYKDFYTEIREELGEEREKSMKLKVENGELKATISDKDSEINRLQKNIESKDARLRKMLAEYQYKSSESDPITDYGNKNSDNDFETLDKELGEGMNTVMNQEQSEDLEKLKVENERLKKQIRDNENTMLNQLDNELQKKDTSLKTSQEDQIRMQKRLEIFEKQNHELKNEIDKHKNNEYNMIELENEYKSLKSERKTMKEKLAKLQAKVKSLEEAELELERLKKTHSNLEDEKKEFKIEIKETRALLEKHKDENYNLKSKIIELEKEMKYANITKMELEAIKNNSQKAPATDENIDLQKKLVEKDNEVLRLQLNIKTLEQDVKSLNDNFESQKREMEREYRNQIEDFKEVNINLSNEKEDIYQEAQEQEKLMVSAMASFYFETLNSQHAQKQKDQGSGEGSSFLKKLRKITYPMSSGY